MPGIGAQCPRSPGGEDQEGLRSAETGSHLSNQAGQRVSEVQVWLLPPKAGRTRSKTREDKRLKCARKPEAVRSGL